VAEKVSFADGSGSSHLVREEALHKRIRESLRFRSFHMAAIRFEDAGHSLTKVPRHSALHWVSNAGVGLVTTLRAWRRRTRDRAELAALDDRMLADIGLSRAEAEFLGNKPFWRE
jgi:uncharacterized protein YjiS (DUF1127 family)